MMPAESPDLLDRLIEAASEDLHAATRGAALCRLTASGSPGATAKRAEGAWAALNALARSLADGGRDPRETAQQLRDTWNADLLRWSADPRSSWVPYCEGGIARLDEYISALSG